MFDSYIAIGDSFTEGIGDWTGPESPRGWADRLAQALRASSDSPFLYANLAIRGRKLLPLLTEQLPVALQQEPSLISINGGGNDMLRPGFEVSKNLDLLFEGVQQATDAGVHVLLLAGPDASQNLPLGHVFHERGSEFTDATAQMAAGLPMVTFVDNFHDGGFSDTSYWSQDGLHLSSAGHLRVAANCAAALGAPLPDFWPDPFAPEPDPKRYDSASYMRTYVAPWIGRRLTGRSSGDGRSAKRPVLRPL